MVKRKPYGLENEKVAGNTPRKGMPLALDDRLISKQYITERIDTKVDDTAFGSSWDYVEGSNENNKVAPSKNAVYDKINSLGVVSDVWTKESSAADSKIRANKTGNYGIGDGNSLNFATIDEKLYIAGNIKATGNYIMATDGSTIGPASGALTLHSTNGALLPTKFMIGTGTAGVPLEISLAGSTATAADGTGIIQAGPDSGANLGIGEDKIQARSGEAVAELKLNTTGGNVTLGDADSTVTVTGDLVVSGAATTLNTATLSVEDNEITLNKNVTGTPSASAGLRVERGDSTDAQLIWNETDDKWQVHDGTSAYDIAHDSHAALTLDTNTASALSLSGQALSLADKFVQHAGDAMTGALTIGSSGDQTNNGGDGTTNLTVFGGPSSGNPAVVINGYLQADNKSFNIEHPTKKGMRLVHGCLEGPEFGIYQRGTIKSIVQIEEIPLPEYWKAMVGDYTVALTPHGNYNVWLEEKNKTMFKIKSNADAIDGPWSCEWVAIGRRTDCSLEVEQDAK
tara:strand:+ start:1932 stop:3470 length:1539 start_codon:yes stop_codon:yes gene_type:complete